MFSRRKQKIYEKRTLDPQYPFELTLELTEDGPNKSVQNTRFSDLVRRFSVFSDLFRTFSGVFGVLGDQGGGDRKVRAKRIFLARESLGKHDKNAGKPDLNICIFPEILRDDFSKIFKGFFRDCSGQKNCFRVNFPIPGPSVPQTPAKPRQFAKKAESPGKKHVLERRLSN